LAAAAAGVAACLEGALAGIIGTRADSRIADRDVHLAADAPDRRGGGIPPLGRRWGGLLLRGPLWRVHRAVRGDVGGRAARDRIVAWARVIEDRVAAGALRWRWRRHGILALRERGWRCQHQGDPDRSKQSGRSHCWWPPGCLPSRAHSPAKACPG